MKILCLLAILANICLLLWEYRNGTFNVGQADQGQPVISGKEQIFLSRELGKGLPRSQTKPKEETRLDDAKPRANANINEIEQHLNSAGTSTKTNPTEYHETQLP